MNPQSSSHAAESIAVLTTNARFRSTHCTALARRLETSAPATLTADQRAALTIVSARAAEVEEVKKARARTAPPALKEPRLAVIVGWSALDGALAAMASLPADEVSAATEAASLRARILPEGNSFFQHDAVSLWGASKMILDRIDEEGLGARVDALVSPTILAHVRRAFAKLGESIGVTGSGAPSLPRRALADAMSRFSYAVASYGRSLTIGLDDTDEAGLTRFLTALAPVEELRVTGKDGEEEDEDEEPGLPAPPLPNGGPFVTT